LIGAIASLGKASKKIGEFSDDLEALVDRSRARNVLVLKIRISNTNSTYDGLEFEKNKGDAKYLYRKDPSGAPGSFITSRIPVTGDLGTKMLRSSCVVLADKKASRANCEEARKTLSEFERKKIVGMTRGKWIRQTKSKFLNLICTAIRDSSNRIMEDICQKIRELDPEELLITIKILEGLREKYLGDIAEFRGEFKSAATQVRTERIKAGPKYPLPLKCVVCNEQAVLGELQSPLPFTFLDKPGFIPGGDFSESYKAFPLCSDCFLDLRRGWKFIEKYLDFSIASIEGGRTEVRFWLVPVLANPDLATPFIKDLDKSAANESQTRFLYLRNLRNMCSTMDAITELSLDNSGTIETQLDAYLTFTAIFYTKDKQGHMRLISRSEGIYPRRLRFLIELKRRIDSLYPFDRIDPRVRFGFPLLREFLAAPNNEGWYKDLASILGNLFNGEDVNKPLIYRAVTRKIAESGKEADLKRVADTSFRALNLIQYVEHLEQS